MRPSKKTMRSVFAARHGAQSAPVLDKSQIRESKGRVIHRDNSPQARTWLDGARGTNGPLAGRMTFRDGTPKLPEGIGDIYAEFDQAESLAGYVNAEFRLQIEEAA